MLEPDSPESRPRHRSLSQINQYKDNLERNRPEILPITVGQSSTPIVGQIWTPVYRDVDFAQLVKLYGAPTG